MKGDDRSKREGEWVYYHENSDIVMNREYYKNGKLHGTQTTYYPDGKKTEEIQYVHGKKEGPNIFMV